MNSKQKVLRSMIPVASRPSYDKFSTSNPNLGAQSTNQIDSPTRTSHNSPTEHKVQNHTISRSISKSETSLNAKIYRAEISDSKSSTITKYHKNDDMIESRYHSNYNTLQYNSRKSSICEMNSDSGSVVSRYSPKRQPTPFISPSSPPSTNLIKNKHYQSSQRPELNKESSIQKLAHNLQGFSIDFDDEDGDDDSDQNEQNNPFLRPRRKNKSFELRDSPKITIYESSSDAKVNHFRSTDALPPAARQSNIGPIKCSLSSTVAAATSSVTNNKLVSKTNSKYQTNNQTNKSEQLNGVSGSETLKLRSSSLSTQNNIHEHQLAKIQLKEKDFKITELIQSMEEQERTINNLYYEMNKKDDRVIELMNEIKKRKQDMIEMSKKIIELDRELKQCSCSQLEYESNSTNRPLSQLSFDSSRSEQTLQSHKWRKIAYFSKALKKPMQKKLKKKSGNGDFVNELKSILREKDMIITDLRLESKLTNHRLEEMENTLRKREEESLLIKKNNNYLEKAMKSKILD